MRMRILMRIQVTEMMRIHNTGSKDRSCTYVDVRPVCHELFTVL